MVMEISVQEELKDVDYTVTINNQKIQTNIEFPWNTIKKHRIAKGWVQAIQRIYLKKLHRNENIVVGLNTVENWYTEQISLLNLSIGSHCLIIDVEDGWRTIPAPLRSFLSDPRVIFVGVDMGSVVKKLEEDNKVMVTSRIVDLRVLVEEALDRYDLRKYSLERLGKLVLGDDMDLNKPDDFHNFGNDPMGYMYFTADAFLSQKIGVRCMEILCSQKMEEKAS